MEEIAIQTWFLKQKKYKQKTRLLFEFWKEWRQMVSAANADSDDDEVNLNSNDADNSDDNRRWRATLRLRGFCFSHPPPDFSAYGYYKFQLFRVPILRN